MGTSYKFITNTQIINMFNIHPFWFMILSCIILPIIYKIIQIPFLFIYKLFKITRLKKNNMLAQNNQIDSNENEKMILKDKNPRLITKYLKEKNL